MRPELFQAAAAVFLDVRAAPVSERERLLADRCGGDNELRQHVERLLAQDGSREDLFDDDRLAEGLDIAAVDDAMDAACLEHSREDVVLPASIGRYRIIRRIGEGGMGIVCEAQQDNPRRVVALKLLRAGLMARTVLRRFSHEAQILAHLHHPGIACVYDAGVADTPAGPQPYFAMELIAGRPLLQHAAGLATDAKLRLFLLVAAAVEYAHAKGVIHRDLKPANILVDEHGQPRVLDFGVARVTNADLQMTTLHTDAGQLVGTLAYMSPEQVSGSAEGVDARADVYALGVVLFEMLAGCLPIDFRLKSVPEATRLIRDQEPTRLGAVDTNARGDLETIIARALEKDPARRYQSAAGLAADIRRFLNHEPIEARPATRMYQFRKFARRHSELVIGLSATFAVLVAGIVGTTWGLLRAQHQRDMARGQAIKANRVAAAMERVLINANPRSSAAAGEGTMALIRKATTEASAELGSEPDLEWRFLCMAGQTLQGMGALEAAIESLRRADALALQLFGPEHPTRLDTARQLAAAMCEYVTCGSSPVDLRAELIERSRDMLAVARRVLGRSHPTAISLLNSASYAAAYLNWAQDPEKSRRDRDSHEELVELLRRLPSEQRPCPLSFALARLALCRSWIGDRELATEAADEAMRLYRSGPEVDNDDTVAKPLGLPDYLSSAMRLREAVDLLNIGLQRLERTRGPSHLRTNDVRHLLAVNWSRLGDPRSAWINASDRLASMRPLYRPWEPDLAFQLMFIGHLAGTAGRLNDARFAFAEAQETIRRDTPSSLPKGMLVESWVKSACVVGLRTHMPWGSEVLCHESRWALTDQMTAHPSESLDPDQVQWKDLEFTLLRHDAKAIAPRTGHLDGLWSEPEPMAGAYKLSIRVPDGPDVRAVVDWILVAPWRVRKYTSRWLVILKEAQWVARLAEPPDEEFDSSTITDLGWWGRGFGPLGQDYNFGLVADATVELPTGDYTFVLDADDGGRVTLDDRVIIDMWPDTRRSGSWESVQRVAPGPHRLRVEYVQWGGMSRLRLRAIPCAPVLQPEDAPSK